MQIKSMFQIKMNEIPLILVKFFVSNKRQHGQNNPFYFLFATQMTLGKICGGKN